ncbi:MAG TPA: SDR family oxidoreductase [Thermoleophilaceae bacterium]|nr:SDR family oxidoreductase [Thermoleophilaceae bacterium]
MHIAIAGGHGQIALRLTRFLRIRGDTVRSLIRNPDHSDDVRDVGAEPVVCDLEHATEKEVATAIRSVDAVVFAAGAGPGSGSERKETVDYGGAVKLIAATKAKKISRYVMVSAMGADPSAEGDDTYSIYARAKGRADAELEASGLSYTIIRPGSLTDDPGNGRVEIAERLEGGSISRDDVAAVVAKTAHARVTIGWTFDLVAGETRIDEALASLREHPPPTP